jgi:hypothetical protein
MSKPISRCRIRAAANDPRPLLVTIATKPTVGGVTWVSFAIAARTTHEALAWGDGFFELLGTSSPTVNAASPAVMTPANSNHPAHFAAPANPPVALSVDLVGCVE